MYCYCTWCTTNFSKVTEIQSLCNRNLRLIFQRHPCNNIDDIYKKFAILTVRDKFKFEICCFVYKFLYRRYTDCFSNFFQRSSEVHSRRTRQSNNLNLPLFKKSTSNQSIKLVFVVLPSHSLGLWAFAPASHSQGNRLQYSKQFFHVKATYSTC